MQAKNYRPICVMPLLYKLFSVLLQRRLAPTLDAQLSKEQAGFRKDYSILDHLHTLKRGMLAQQVGQRWLSARLVE